VTRSEFQEIFFPTISNIPYYHPDGDSMLSEYILKIQRTSVQIRNNGTYECAYGIKKMVKQLFIIGFILTVACKPNSSLSKPVIFKNEYITGEIYKHTFSSNMFKDKREIFVWVPNNYNKTNDEYSTLILHDGQNVFHPGASMSGHEWHLDETVTKLIQSNEIEPIIMIGVSNSQNRATEYNPLEHGEKYGKYLTQELIPALKSQYRITDDRKRIGTMGASMGGLISFYLGWEINDHFSKAVCLSPAFRYNDFNYVEQLRNSSIPENLKLVIVNGTEDLDKILQIGVNDCIEFLESVHFPDGDLLYWISQGDSHTELAWAKQSQKALMWLYSK